MTSVKPGVRLCIAAPFAGLQNSRSGSRPVPWSTCSQTHEGSSLGCPRHRRRRPDKSSQAGVGPISGQGYLGAAPAPATGPKGWRGGPDSPSPAETPSPPPLSPASSQKGSGGGEAEAASLVQRPWAAALKDGTFGGLFTSGDTSQHSPSAWSLLPKGGAVPLRDSGLLPPTPRQVTMPAEGRWVFPRTLSQSL